MLEVLLAAGADVEAQRRFGATPLHDAARSNENPAVLAAGANLEARDEDGNTPLHRAAAFGYVRGDNRVHAGPAIEALLDAEANAMARNAAGETPWDLAQANEALQGTDGYWRLNDARFDVPGGAGTPDSTTTPAGRAGATGRGQAVVAGGGTTPSDGVGGAAAPSQAIGSGGSCQIPGYPNPGDMTNLGLSSCPARVDFHVRALALQAAGIQCALTTADSQEVTPEIISEARRQIREVCDRLAAVDEAMNTSGASCRCPAGFGP